MVEQITSKQLKELLTSFKVCIPEDLLNESFVRHILTEQLIEKLINEIKSLSKEVWFKRDVPKQKEKIRPMEVCVVEVDVVCDQDEITVVNEV